jgi:tetraacyldisaccharide 4'-kinase
MVIKTIELLLQAGLQPAVVTRGYKRTSRGIGHIESYADAVHTGDEPMLIHQHFPDIPVIVGSNRIKAIDYVREHFPATRIIVMDDGFQHRWLKPSLNILLTSYDRPFVYDHLLPAGYLREPPQAAQRAHLIIITRTPAEATESEKKLLVQHISRYSSAPVIFTGIQYRTPRHLSDQRELITHENGICCLAVCGIAHPDPFLSHLKGCFPELHEIIFPNHHRYNEKDIRLIVSQFNNIAAKKKVIITTGKDAVKLGSFAVLSCYPVYYLPVEPTFTNEEWKLFKNLIEDAGKN